MGEPQRSGPPGKFPVVALLLVVNTALLGLIVAKQLNLFGSGPEQAIRPSQNVGSVEELDGEPITFNTVEDGGSTQLWSIESALDVETTCDNPALGEPLLIGYAADFGQRSTSADTPAVVAATHLANRISCNGGVRGRPVEVEVVDVSEEASKVQDLIDSGAIAIIGPAFKDSGLAVLEITNGEVPVVFATSTEPSLADRMRLSFLASFDYQRGASVAAKFAVDREWTRAVLFSGQEDDYYSLSPAAFKTAFESQGGKVVGDFPYLLGESTDFASAIDQFEANPPDVIYSAMLAPQAAALRAQLEERGLDIDFIGADSLEASGAYLTPGLDGVYHVTHVFPTPGGWVDRLNASIEVSTGGSSSSPTYAALAGDAMAVILDAYARTGSDDPRTIGEAIAISSGVQGVSGVLGYQGAGQPTKSVYIHQIVDGQPTLTQEVRG